MNFARPNKIALENLQTNSITMRYKILIEYDGTNILGWQRQLDGPSVQEYLETALTFLAPKEPVKQDESASTGSALQAPAATLPELRHKSGFGEENADADTERKTAAYNSVREDLSTGSALQTPATTRFIEVFGAGRTDAGVHALAQVAHFDLEREIEDWKLRDALNFHLREMGAPVVILDAEPVPDTFNARFSAKGRSYIYRILNRRTPAVLQKNRVWWVPVELDVEKMRQAAVHLLGHHDFSSFRAAACQAKSPLKTLDKLDITISGEEIIFAVEARSFLHHQVRNMVGTLKLVGDGHLQPEDIKTILEAKDRKAAGPTAPACGLYLSKVWY